MVITNESMGAYQLLGAHARADPPKSTSMFLFSFLGETEPTEVHFEELKTSRGQSLLSIADNRKLTLDHVILIIFTVYAL